MNLSNWNNEIILISAKQILTREGVFIRVFFFETGGQEKGQWRKKGIDKQGWF
jgi:hypothetical protein